MWNLKKKMITIKLICRAGIETQSNGHVDTGWERESVMNWEIGNDMYTLLPSRFNRVGLCATIWASARQAALSMGILQATILEWVVMPSSRDRTQVSCIAGRSFTV